MNSSYGGTVNAAIFFNRIIFINGRDKVFCKAICTEIFFLVVKNSLLLRDFLALGGKSVYQGAIG
jgi:hypothetical protein